MKSIILLLALTATVFGYAAAQASPSEMCLPVEAQGVGTDFTQVNYIDEKVTIYTYFCNGQPMSVIALHKWGPVFPAPQGKKLAEELKRLNTLQGYSNEITPEHHRKAEAQLRDYPNPSIVKPNKKRSKASIA